MFKACLEPMFQSRHEHRATAKKILSILVEHRAKMSMSICDCVKGLLKMKFAHLKSASQLGTARRCSGSLG